ncbi:hypothetical protein KP509_1Z050700 [Ceratopteris richardii]|nr:hypothetical protein KP509_1Z050700 [Ceratopteris richardii]
MMMVAWRWLRRVEEGLEPAEGGATEYRRKLEGVELEEAEATSGEKAGYRRMRGEVGGECVVREGEFAGACGVVEGVECKGGGGGGMVGRRRGGRRKAAVGWWGGGAEGGGGGGGTRRGGG